MNKPNKDTLNNEQINEQDEEESLDLEIKRTKSLQTNVKGGGSGAWPSQSCPAE